MFVECSLGRRRAGSRAQSGLRRRQRSVHGGRRGVQLRAEQQAEDDDPDGMYSTYMADALSLLLTSTTTVPD
jgi:hypothetical protein